MTIPFNRPQRAGREEEYIAAAIDAGRIGGSGEFSAKCETFLEQSLGAAAALLTPSCTAALEMAALLLDIQPGDEVIVPSFTFPSTANAFVLRGAKPVFADIRSDTLNIDESKLEQLITPRTKAIVLLHYAGVGCEMNAIVDLARRHNVRLVEDNAHGLFAKYDGKYLGTFAPLTAQSFHETKNFTCGEGGALLVNDEQLVARAEIIREKGTNRASFYRGEIDKYSWVDIGSSYIPSELQAAFLWAQLEQRDRIQSDRERIWSFYFESLGDWTTRRDAQLPGPPDNVEHSAHLFYMVMKTADERDSLIAHLARAGIQSTFHYLPLHLSKMGRRFGGKPGDCPTSESISGRLIRLPFFGGLTNRELTYVVEAVQGFGG